MKNKITFGLIVGNRGFFPDQLVVEGREKMLDYLKQKGIDIISLSTEDTKYGSVETLEDAYKCGKLFFNNREKIEGIIVTLPNFGDEKGIANSIKFSTLNIPVLIHAFPDYVKDMSLANRRDSFCGKLSACNNLYQYKIKYSLTTNHTVDILDKSFTQDVEWFTGVCKVVNGLKNARIGAIGARTGPFNTVRFSEKLLENAGISTEVIDLSEILGQIGKIKDTDQMVVAKVKEIKNYIKTEGISENALVKMAKFSVIIRKWIDENKLNATAIQCWTSLEDYFGIVPCTVMSMLSHDLIPGACEVDIPGAISMYALQLASDSPSAIVDWNNNYGNDPDKAVIFHCSNYPKEFFEDVKMQFQDIISHTVGKENTYGTCVGRIKSGPFTYARISTDDYYGIIKSYVGEGEITDDPLDTFGGYGVVKINNMQNLLKHICENGFEHHVAINKSKVAKSLKEAFDKYLEWEVYYHE
jgi:L-fucose isomerase-like protein